ncbi:MAG: hypothetical protein OM95_14085 [Bdellovibrio sp. ArHS]|uniref:hypothetical protein n=1 Tax=Bdellovibrio sp. ArHS TaxID=1569284 RepID=UPI00058286FF|nr:hypothetical protein [Bdellovibrio sp. ArHS]KHD87496.1 MAG: hypothetical protein OM95_14085 [Bdellovibrio sp. ArHS]
MKYLLGISVIIAISAGCSTRGPQKGHRNVATVSDVCAKLSAQISDPTALNKLGCNKEGRPSDIFVGKSLWKKGYNGGTFNETETLGVIMDAVRKAHSDCSRQYTLCVVKSVGQEYVTQAPDYGREVAYKVIIQGVDSKLDNGALKKFEGSSSISQRRQSALHLLSAEYAALARALNSCYEEGFTLCAVAGLPQSETGYNSQRESYYANATAVVIGLEIAHLRKMSAQPAANFKVEYGVAVPTVHLESALDVDI